MPRLDRPSSGGDSGGDKPPAPKPPARELREPVNPPQARNRTHFEHSAVEQNSRRSTDESASGQGRSQEKPEGTSQNGSHRPEDKPSGERGTHGREFTTAGDSGEHPCRPGDTSRETDKPADTVKQYQALFERQGELIDAQKQRVDTLKSDIDKLEKRNQKLEDRNDKLETRLEQRDQIIDRQANEIGRLKAELAKKNDKPAEARTAVDKSPYAAPRADKPVNTPDRPWYKKFPSEKLVGIGTTIAGLGQAIAAGTHHMSSAESGIITAGIGVGVSILGYAREKYTERKARNADRPEN